VRRIIISLQKYQMIIIWFLICDTFTLYHFSCFILKYIVLMFFVLLDKLVIISSTDKNGHNKSKSRRIMKTSAIKRCKT